MKSYVVISRLVDHPVGRRGCFPLDYPATNDNMFKNLNLGLVNVNAFYVHEFPEGEKYSEKILEERIFVNESVR